MAAEISSEVSDSANDTHSVTVKNFDVKELEVLLEPYFVQINGTLNTISTVWIPFYCKIFFLAFIFFGLRALFFSYLVMRWYISPIPLQKKKDSNACGSIFMVDH